MDLAGAVCDESDCTKIALVLLLVVVAAILVVALTFVGALVGTTSRLRRGGWGPWPARGVGLAAGFGVVVLATILSVIIPVVPVLGVTAIAMPIWAVVERRKWRHFARAAAPALAPPPPPPSPSPSPDSS